MPSWPQARKLSFLHKGWQLYHQSKSLVYLLKLTYFKVIDFGLSKTYGVVQDSPLKKKGMSVPSQSPSSNIMKTRAGTVMHN